MNFNESGERRSCLRNLAQYDRTRVIDRESTRALKLMLVDDEPVIVDTLAIVLRQHGYDCTLAYSGPEAIEKARQLHPQFILMGVVMPGMNGTEAGRIILDEQPECKMFFFSGWHGAGLLFEDLEHRGYTFGIMPKPLHPQELLKKLRELGLEPSTTSLSL